MSDDTKGTPRPAPYIPDGDGAVRELEKEALAHRNAPNLRPAGTPDPPVAPLAKDPDRAPEDAVRDVGEPA